jgi:hypothetical protein
MAEHLSRSLRKHNIEIDILAPDNMDRILSKHQKIIGILNAPKTCKKIIFLDADTLVLDPKGIENVKGAWKIPWKIPPQASVPKNLDPKNYLQKLEDFYLSNDLLAFSKGGEREGVEWNSGVIVGDREILIELAEEWAFWWDRILDLFDGSFRRDQLSFRIAYYKVFKSRHQLMDLPVNYNWIASYFGINPNARILHKTMVKNIHWLDNEWKKISNLIALNKSISTKNKIFDLQLIQNDKPCLKECTHSNLKSAVKMLTTALKTKRPKNVLVYKNPDRNKSIISHLIDTFPSITFTDSSAKKNERGDFDFIIFNSNKGKTSADLLPWIDDDVICCYFFSHDLNLYRSLFQFKYVRFINYSFVIFSNSPEIINWNFNE